MRWRRLLLCLLFALTFDAVVPFEPTAAGRLQLDDDLEEAAQLRARRDHGREARAATRGQPTPRIMDTSRVHASIPRVIRPHRPESSARPVHFVADPTAPPPPSGEDH